MVEIDDKVIEYLKKLASRKCWWENHRDPDNFIVNDYAGGNIDDAYQGGIDDGECQISREILASLKIEW